MFKCTLSSCYVKKIFSCTCKPSSCYINTSSLALANYLHAMLARSYLALANYLHATSTRSSPALTNYLHVTLTSSLAFANYLHATLTRSSPALPNYLRTTLTISSLALASYLHATLTRSSLALAKCLHATLTRSSLALANMEKIIKRYKEILLGDWWCKGIPLLVKDIPVETWGSESCCWQNLFAWSDEDQSQLWVCTHVVSIARGRISKDKLPPGIHTRKKGKISKDQQSTAGIACCERLSKQLKKQAKMWG